MSDAASLPIREQAIQLAQALPPDASWDDLMYRIYVRQAIDQGMADSETDNVVDVAKVRRQFGLAP